MQEDSYSAMFIHRTIILESSRVGRSTSQLMRCGVSDAFTFSDIILKLLQRFRHKPASAIYGAMHVSVADTKNGQGNDTNSPADGHIYTNR